MENREPYFSREIDPGMGMAVAKRTYLRPGECWADLAFRVAEGNCSLVPTSEEEQHQLTRAIAKASFLPAGRHLQHGDNTQKNRNIEVFSNCSTSCSSFIKFYLLLNGSGVGRMYNDDLMLIDWHNMPDVILMLDPKHKDFSDFIRLIYGLKIKEYLKKNNLLEKWPTFDTNWLSIGLDFNVDDVNTIHPYDDDKSWFDMEDSREGWGKGLEILEVMTFEKKLNHQLVIDFSLVRESGSPIGGMQNRPASGPAYTAYAFWKTLKVKKDIFSYYDFALSTEVESKLTNPAPSKTNSANALVSTWA